MNNRQTHSFSIWLYLLIVFGLSWPFQIASALWATSLLTICILNSSSMVMVAVGTFIAGKCVFRDSFTDAGWHWAKPRYYAAVLGLVAVLWILPTLADLKMGTVHFPPTLTGMQTASVFLYISVMLIPGFCEEFGWRGYMLPRIVHRMGIRKGVLIHAVIWWAWHLPAVTFPQVRAALASAENSGTSAGATAISVAAILVISAVPTILHAVVFAYIWTRSRSLAVSTVYHGAYDGVRDSIGRTIGMGPVASTWSSAVLIILGISLLWRGNWRNLSPDRQHIK